MSGGGGGTISTSEPRLGALQVQQSSYGVAIPIVYGRTRISGNLIWYGDFVAIANTTTTSSGGKGGGGGVTQKTTTYTYEAAVMMGLCEGPISGIVSVWQEKKRFQNTDSKTAIEQLGLSVALGHIGQSPWSHLSNNHPSQAVGYSSTAYLSSAAFSLTNNAQVQNHSFELDGKLQFGSGIVDANPRDVIYDLLTNVSYGANFPTSSIGDLSVYSNYCQAMGLFISPAFTEQEQACDNLRMIASLTNSAYVWSEGKLKLVPYGDEAITGNGATYTPNLTPVYDLTDDDFIVGSSEDPVNCTRSTPADAFNQVQVEYLNRDNAYNIEISEAKDQANIEEYGLRPQDPVKMHGICDPDVARHVAQLLLQRSLYVRNKYEFKLGWKYALLEPMDLVTLTDPGLGLSKSPVRITGIEEDEDGLLSVQAEDYPFGVASATLYPSQSGSGYAANYNALPGNVSAPVFFEAPVELANASRLEVWCAVSGQASIWGGCEVWASIDGLSYKLVDTIYGGARYGATTAATQEGSTATASVSLTGLGGQMLSGSAQDAAQLNTLCWMGTPEGGEYFSYETAALTATNAYTLSNLNRGAYRSTQSAHPAATQFVRVDQAIAKSKPLDLSMVGETIYFKFLSFNAYCASLQLLSDVQEYAYKVTGSMLKIPPNDVTQFTINGDVMSWTPVSELDLAGYKIRFHYGINSWWPTATPLHDGVITESPYTFVNRPTGPVTMMIKAVDTTGNESKNAATLTLNLGDALVDNIINSWPQNPSWDGIKTNCSVIGDQLVANDSSQFYGSNEQPIYGGDMQAFYSEFQSQAMQYEFEVETDGTGRLTLYHSITASSYTIEYSRDNTDAFFGPDADFFYSANEDPMYGTPTDWTVWPGSLQVVNGEFIRFRIKTSGGSGIESIDTLGVDIDVPDINIVLNDVVISPGGSRLPVPAGLLGIKNIQITVQADGNGGITSRYSDKSNLSLGPMAYVLDQSAIDVAGLIDAVIQAY